MKQLNDIALNSLIKFGNTKLNKAVAIYNVDSAHNCPNRASERCQVKESECYALNSETRFPSAKKYRERQANFIESISAKQFSDQFKAIKAIKRNKVKALRFNVASDIKNNSQLRKLDKIASALSLPVYTYSASTFLSFNLASNLIIMASNKAIYNEYGKQSNIGYFKVVNDHYKRESIMERENNWKACEGKDCGESCELCLKGNKVLQVIH